MESRGFPRRDPGGPTDEPVDPFYAGGEEPAPGPLFEASGDDLDTPDEQALRGRGFDDEDDQDDEFSDPRVTVTHSLQPRRPGGGEREREIDRPEAESGGAEMEGPAQAGLHSTGGEKEEDEVTQEAPPIANAVPDPRPPSPPRTDPQGAPPVAAAPVPAHTRFSPDGEWWWNGATWLPAVSHDGLWRWDGASWILQVASGLEPERLVEGLDELAVVRYRRRGLLLARHANDWPVPPDLTQAMAEATEILEQRAATERRMQGLEAPPPPQGRRMGGLLSRVAGSDDEHRRLRTEVANMNAHLEPRLLRIGRDAPRPTFRESDEVLETAQHLAAAAREVTTAHEAVLAAQAEWQARVAAATADLEQRIAERDARIAEAEVGVREAEARREHRIADAWRRLAEVRMPGKGEHVTSFGPLHLFAARIDMPNAAGPTAGARAVIGSAAELTQAEPRALEDLFLVGDSGAADLHWAETNGDPTPYLLVITESGSALLACGENEGEARRFARQVASAAATADAMRDARRARLTEARAAVQQAEDDHSEIEVAQANRTAAEQDPQLLQAVERARDRLSLERDETADIDQTGASLQEVLDRLTTAPQPLPTTAG
jgi:hypothetical protein